jgi:N-acetylmuramoyl-L-alanine amidase
MKKIIIWLKSLFLKPHTPINIGEDLPPMEAEPAAEVIVVEQEAPPVEISRSVRRKSKFLWLIDAGHGGIEPNTGRYTTAPAKMYRHKDFTFFEGEYNRDLANLLASELDRHDIDFQLIHHDYKDLHLNTRIDIVNRLHRTRNCRLISLHGNAGVAPNVERAHGFSVHVSPRASKASREMATMLGTAIQMHTPELFYRRQHANKAYWEDNFAMISRTNCPAILSENGFFTNPKEAQLMRSPAFQKRIVAAHLDMILSSEL